MIHWRSWWSCSLRFRVNTRLRRTDLTSANIEVAVSQMSYGQIRDSMLSQLAKGRVHYQESYLLAEMMESSVDSSKARDVGERAGIQIPESVIPGGMSISDPTSIRSLVTPDIPMSSIKDSLKQLSL